MDFKMSRTGLFLIVFLYSIIASANTDYPSTIYDVIAIRDKICRQVLSPRDIAANDNLFGFLYSLSIAYPQLYTIALSEAEKRPDCNNPQQWVENLKVSLRNYQ